MCPYKSEGINISTAVLAAEVPAAGFLLLESGRRVFFRVISGARPATNNRPGRYWQKSKGAVRATKTEQMTSLRQWGAQNAKGGPDLQGRPTKLCSA